MTGSNVAIGLDLDTSWLDTLTLSVTGPPLAHIVYVRRPPRRFSRAQSCFLNCRLLAGTDTATVRTQWLPWQLPFRQWPLQFCSASRYCTNSWITAQFVWMVVQFKMVSMRSEKPIIMRSTPYLWEVSPTLPLKRFQCSSDWRWPSLVLSKKIVKLFLF